MTLLLNSSAADFEAQFAALVNARRDVTRDVGEAVRAIIADVRGRGDTALFEYTRRFDRFDPASHGIGVSESELKAAYTALPKRLVEALHTAHDRIDAHHRRQKPENTRYTDALGVELGAQWTPIDAVGLYVPGGLASYPSSVLMNAIPARVAGVPRVVMAAPAPAGGLNPVVLAAAHICGVNEVYRMGGAQAVAALAFGTETIAPVFKIVGPGNAYVAEAKRQVFGTVGIDMVAGPSEVVVVADASVNPAWIACDLLAQAEHDEAAQSILITDDIAFAGRVGDAVQSELSRMPRRDIAETSWEAHGAIIVVGDLTRDAVPLIDRLAPEHLQLCFAEAETVAAHVRNAGAIFIGASTPEAVGDYVGGSNHVLPTARAARFSSGLGTLDFMKRTSILKLTPEALGVLGPPTMTLAEAEGLDGHRRSVAVRLGENAG